jgi:predicted DCC family thiol-disulfide oxidoreductase YuxK
MSTVPPISIPPGAKPILFVTDTCPVCTSTRQMLAPEIQEGKVELVEASQEKAKAILKDVNIKEVPECIIEKDGKFVRCDFDELMKKAAERRL